MGLKAQDEKSLLIDDDDASRTLVKEFAKQKIRIIEPPMGMEAIESVQSPAWELDLVLRDIRLPDCNGWSCLKILIR